MRQHRLFALGVVLLGLTGAPHLTATPGPADPTSMRIVLLVDSSATMVQMVIDFRKAMMAFVDALPVDTEVAIISTGGQLRIRVPPTADRERLAKGIASFASDSGANAFLDSLLESDGRFLKPAADRQPVFVMITTDAPSLSDPSFDRYNKFMNDFVRRRGRAYGVVIRTNTTALGLPSEFVDNLTRNTFGNMETVAVSNGLSDRLRNIAAALLFGR